MSRYNAARQWEKKLCIHVCVTGFPCCAVGGGESVGGNNNKKSIKKILKI